MNFSLNDFLERYEIDLNCLVSDIKKSKAKKVLVQFPDGLKPYAKEIVDYLKEKTGCEIIIYLGSCFGACDLPKSDADLVIQFGHSPMVN